MSAEYPHDWITKELGDFAKAAGGSRFPPVAQGKHEGDYPFYKVSDMNLPGNERSMHDSNNWITESTRKNIKAKTYPSGSVIFPKVGAAVATNKKRLLMRESVVDNNVMAVVINDSNACVPDYLRYWFDTIHISSLSNSGALPSIPAHRVHSQRVTLPPLPEQKKIAHILSTVQRAIEAQEQIIQTTTELFKTMLHQLMTAQISASKENPSMSGEFQETEIGKIPSVWEIDRIDSAFEIQQGKQVSKKNREGDNQRPFLRTKNVFWNRLMLSNLDQMNFTETEETRLELRPGDLLTCEGGDIGRTALWNNEVENCYHQNHLHRLRVKNGMADPQFSVYWFWYAFNIAKIYFGRGNVTTIPNLSQSKLAELPMALPPLPEQKKIAQILSTIQKKADNAQIKKVKLQALFRTLLHELMTAKIRINQIDK